MKEFSFVSNWWQFAIIGIVSYLLGSINYAWLISRAMHKDITKMGSGNPGTMNVTRELGWKLGLLTFVCDALKGGVPMLICYFLYRGYVFAGTLVKVSDFVRYFVAVFVVFGHIYPATMRHHGGKGIASTLGIFWVGLSCESPWCILLGFVVGGIIIAFITWTEWGSLGSLLGVTGCSVIQMVYFVLRYAKMPLNAYMVCLYLFVLSLNVLTWVAHRANIVRLFAGEEHHTSFKKFFKKKK
jgi:glycerol-3-phosphate acyltransferase PlsY